MDEDSGATQTDLTPQPNEPPTEGGSALGKAADMGHNLKEGASKAKDIIGSAAGGGGDGLSGGGLGGAMGKGLGALSGGKSSGGSMDGIKAPGGSKTPSMFKGMEGDASPAKKNSIDGETGDNKNPGGADFAKKVGAQAAQNSKTGQKVKQGVEDAVNTARDVADVFDGNWGDLAKNFLKDPKAFIKRYGRVFLYAIGAIVMQFLVIGAILGVFFFGLYKVYLTAKEVTKHPWDIANDLRVSREMGGYLAKFVTQLTYEREQAERSKNGVAFAESATQKNYNLANLKVNPETEKMYTAWDNAGLAAKFMDDYHAKIVPNGSVARQVDSYDPAAWDLYINENNIGPLTSDRAQAFISVFTEDTTHWNDIYTRIALKGAAKTKFDNASFKLDLPDSKKDIDKSRENVTKKIVGDTLKPVSGNADKYYGCLIDGGSDNCDSLGLGSKSSPSNNQPPASCGGSNPLSQAVCVAFNTVQSIVTALNNKKLATTSNLKQFSTSKAEEVTPDSSKYENKASLAANITTAASDSILKGVDSSSQGAPDSDSLVQLYNQFQTATDNQNYSRVNYDRSSKQSVAQAENYFIAGGQLLNGDMGIVDSWALTENLSTLESSQTFRAAVLGNSVGLYAQDSDPLKDKTCQVVYNDEGTVKSIKDNPVDRGVKNSSCFTQSLVPNISELKNEKTLNQIYDQLENQSKKKSSGGWLANLISVFNSKVSAYQNNQVRRSPVSTAAVDIDTSLSPDFDAYTNQVYGVSKTGAEVDGQAYDTLKMAGESLWSAAATNTDTSTGGSYQSDASVAKTMQYAARFERMKLAYQPLSERLFALSSPDSLAGKLALLAPTSPSSGISKTLALMSPSNLTSAVASRMTPTTFAQTATTTATVNPVGAVRVAYSSGDPSITMDSQKLWDTYKCAEGGPTQENAQPDGIPFTLPSSTNPCKQASVLSVVSTCYLNEGDTCKLGNGNAVNTGGESATPGEIGQDTSATPCYPGTNSVGIRDDAYTKGSRIRINLCEIPNIPCSNEECMAFGKGHALANSVASEAWFKLAEKAKALGKPLSATSSWRSMEHQQRLCNGNSLCRSGTYSAVARPGTSNHQAGVAMDISEAGAGQGASSGRSCTNPQTVNTPTYQFLEQYARTFGIKHYANESWHWGTAEKC